MNLENYTGHKNIPGLYQKIINQIPKFHIYYELFAGSAAIASLLNLSENEVVLNDIDPDVFKQLDHKFSLPVLNLKNENAIDILKRLIEFDFYFNTDLKDFIFLDPPYHHSKRNNHNLYKYEMSDADHIQLLQLIIQLESNCMIIHPKCDLYDTMLKDWRKVDVKERYHNKTQIVTMYMNYAEPTELQCYDYLGNNCWERQQIDRKLKRLKDKFSLMPVQQKNYFLKELNKL